MNIYFILVLAGFRIAVSLIVSIQTTGQKLDEKTSIGHVLGCNRTLRTVTC